VTFRDWTRSRYRVKRGGILFFLALFLVSTAALVSANNLLFLIVAAMLATLLVSGLISKLVLAGLELELTLPDHVSARRATAARLRLRNSKWLIPSFSIHLASEGVNAVIPDPLYFPLLPGRRTAEESVQAIFPRRGAHRENLFVLSTRFPFGFIEKTARVALRKDTLVYPCLDPQPGFEALLRGILGETAQEHRGQGADLYRIRPYIASESARHVDWKSSAHTGSLQVREYSSEELGSVEIFLDRTGNPPRAWFEKAVECCAFLVWELSEQRRSVSLVSQGFEAREDCYAMLKFLALAEPLQGVEIAPVHNDAAYQIHFSTSPESQDFANLGGGILVGSSGLLANGNTTPHRA